MSALVLPVTDVTGEAFSPEPPPVTRATRPFTLKSELASSMASLGCGAEDMTVVL